MSFITGHDRHQVLLLPPRLEDFVTLDNPVRFLDAFVDKLDLQQMGFQFPRQDGWGRGRPGYHPGVLVRLYLYGYLNRVRSSRGLEAECYRNVEVIWLLRQLRPDFKTIADFRKDNAAAFKEVVRQFTRICRQLNLFGGQLLAIDGTKIKASNAADQNWSQTKLEKQLAHVETQLEKYLKELEKADVVPAAVSQPVTAAELKAKIDRLQECKDQTKRRLDEVVQSGQTQVSATDPDSRGMKGKQGHVVGYNVQASVDAKHHLLVTTEVINQGADQGQLAAVAQAAKEELQLDRADVVADGGYAKCEDIRTCQQIGLEPHLPAVNNSPSERANRFGKRHFTYDAARNVYRCPAGQWLTYGRQTEDKGRRVFNYSNAAACQGCALKAQCTGTAFRTITRWEHEQSMERMQAAVAAHPEKLAKRKTLIEHTWGTLKHLLAGGFLVRGLAKVSAEVSLAHFSYNLKRALAVVGLRKLLEALDAGPIVQQGGPQGRAHA